MRLPTTAAAFLIAFGIGSAAPRAFADDPAPAGPKPADAPKAPESKTREQVIRIVDELREDVAKVRGLSWKFTVPADLLTREQLKANLAQMIKEELDVAQYEKDVKLLRRLGMLKEDEDPLEIERAFLEVGIAGYYNPKTKRLYLIDGLTGDGQRPTIFHELVHALEDQYFDYESRSKPLEKDSDKTFALKCTIEGSAEHGRMLYEKMHPDIKMLSMKEQMTKEKVTEQKRMLDRTPAFLILPTLLNYQTGPKFVGRAIGDDYAGGMERLFADTPVSEEQVLHPDRYLSADRDLPQHVTWNGDIAAAAGEGWKEVADQEFGELDFALWVDYFLGGSAGKLNGKGVAKGQWYAPSAKKAAEGWDGCWGRVFGKDGAPTALLLASVWDTNEDALEAAQAIHDAMKVRYGAAWHGGEWKTGDEWTHLSDYDATNGKGRIRVSGTTVEMLEGVPTATFEAAWAALSKTTFQKDPKDTFDVTKVVDPFAGVAWRDDAHGLGWKSPGEGWTVAAGAAGGAPATTFKKGGIELRVSVKAGEVTASIQPLIFGIMAKAKGFNPMKDVAEMEIAGRSGGRVSYLTVDAKAGTTEKHVLYLAGLDEATLLIEAAGAEAGWDDTLKEVEAAVAGFIVKE